MTSLSIKLEARSAVHRCFRAYQIDVDTDLFGVWLVEMSYGRIGGLGRSKIRSFPRSKALRRKCMPAETRYGTTSTAANAKLSALVARQ